LYRQGNWKGVPEEINNPLTWVRKTGRRERDTWTNRTSSMVHFIRLLQCEKKRMCGAL